MGKDVNKVMATGRLGADPEMRYTPNGSAVTTFRIASGRNYTKDGQKIEETEWINCVAWEKLAEICNQYLTKGSRVAIEGRLQTRSWEDRDSGEKRYRTEVVLTDMIMLDTKRSESPGESSESESPPSESHADSSPNRTPRPPAPAGRPTRNAPRPIENDEDLPF